MSLVLQDVLQDLRFGARLPARTPGLSAVLVLTSLCENPARAPTPWTFIAKTEPW